LEEIDMSPVIYEKDGAVGIVTLSKPPHNLIDEALLQAILANYRRAVEEGCRAILLRSAMRHFCAGADTNGLGVGDRRRSQESFEAVLEGLEDAPVPTIAAVHGAALGGGLELALTCDMIVAADTAKFAMAEASLGLLPLLGGTQRMAQRVGSARAKEMAMFARNYSALRGE
jgi:enoyl-CoA hydratase/carnithine racemase